MLKEDMPQQIAGEIDRIEHDYLVGRDYEIQFFLNLLNDHHHEIRILNLYGTSGVGKSYLLDEFRRLSMKMHVPFIGLDSRAFPNNPSEFCLYLLRLIHYPNPQLEKLPTDPRLLADICAEELQKTAQQGKMILALDTIEELGDLEYWLREEFLTLLSPKILTIAAGRFPLYNVWLSSPAWQQMIYRLPIEDLSFDAVKQYLLVAGYTQNEMIHHIWSKTKGHPLTLSLYVYSLRTQKQTWQSLKNDQAIIPHVVKAWLKEAPDPEIRELVEAAAVLRLFNQETLSFILDRHVASEQFLKLISFSFIRRVDRGWLLHDLLRDAISSELRQQMPDYYNTLWKRCVLHYYLQIKASMHSKSASWESVEWVYYSGDQFIHTLFYQQSITYHLDPLHHSNWLEAEQYIAIRRLSNHDMRIQSEDLTSEERLEYLIKADESRLWFNHIDLQQLFDLDARSVKIIRDAKGKVFGLAVIVPIHEGTLDYLITHPLYAAYFLSLPETKLKELRTPREAISGYFIGSLDVKDYTDLSMRQAAGHTFISYMLSAGLIVTTAPPNSFFHSIFRSLGFEKVKDVVHYPYDNQTPTPYFVLDTRGKKMLTYLNKTLAKLGLAQEIPDEPLHHLSKRERDVVKLLIKGHTNSEIASELCLSEATVKKHVFNIFRTLQVKNRMQLMNTYRD